MRQGARRGTTLVELMMVVALMSILLTLATPTFTAMRDRASVVSATAEVVATLASARSTAIARGAEVAALVDDRLGELRLVDDTETVLFRPLAAMHGVTLSATRDVVTYGPTGRGSGASNSRVIVSRGAAADTVFVSRLGRVRH